MKRAEKFFSRFFILLIFGMSFIYGTASEEARQTIRTFGLFGVGIAAVAILLYIKGLFEPEEQLTKAEAFNEFSKQMGRGDQTKFDWMLKFGLLILIASVSIFLWSDFTFWLLPTALPLPLVGAAIGVTLCFLWLYTCIRFGRFSRTKKIDTDVWGR